MNKGLTGTIAIASLALAGCDALTAKLPTGEVQAPRSAQQRIDDQRKLQQLCASPTTYDRLKIALFERAARMRGERAAVLDALQSASIVRMESPVVTRRDEALGLTTCAGRLVLELPPQAERAFGGERRLIADVDYSAQRAVDDSGIVYRLQGADAIAQRLASVRVAARPAVVPIPEALPLPASPPEPAPPEPAPQAPEPPIVERRADPVTPQPRATAPPPAATITARPSFDCRRARARVEYMICGREDLAAADRRMSATFFRALATADPTTRADLERSRNRFLSFRNRCGDEACVAQAYADRIREINDIARQ